VTTSDPRFWVIATLAISVPGALVIIIALLRGYSIGIWLDRRHKAKDDE